MVVLEDFKIQLQMVVLVVLVEVEEMVVLLMEQVELEWQGHRDKDMMAAVV
jgi:hypothetical protein